METGERESHEGRAASRSVQEDGNERSAIQNEMRWASTDHPTLGLTAYAATIESGSRRVHANAETVLRMKDGLPK
jgi:hypothetical protein